MSVTATPAELPAPLPPGVAEKGAALLPGAWWRNVALLVPLLAITAPVFWVFGQQPETPIAPGTWGLVVLSAIANVIVIAYHYTIPAHPKFLMLPWRRWVLRVHILSGTIELVAGLVACFSHAPTAALIMGIAALFFHVPSAFFQTRIVFGSKAIMVPSYLLCILTHGFCAGMLIANPDSRMWAVNTFLVFNVYVWCRIYYYVFDLLGLFSAEKYTIAILAAGATMIPALFGSLGFMLLVAFIGLYVLLYRGLFIRSPAAYRDFVRERARESAMQSESAPLWNAPGVDEPRAADYFQLVDHDRDGALDRDELRRALAPWGLPAHATDEFADRLLAGGRVDPARFEEHIWSIGAVRNHGVRAVATERAASERDKAGLVFRHLDFNGDGALTRLELDLLLHEWGLPAGETSRYLKWVEAAGGRIEFDAFFQRMRPMWRYIYYDVFRAEYARTRGDMIGRSVNAIVAARKTDALRARMKRELLARVPFLSGAGDELIGDLAASVVTEQFSAGSTVFTEGSRGQHFYLVASGRVRVTRGGEVVAHLDRGGCVGEGALLTDEPRNASVSVVDDTVLFSLTRESFQYLTEKYPAVRAELERLHQERVRANTRSPIQPAGTS